MPTIQGRVSYHHNSDKTPYRFVQDIPEGSDPDVHTLLMAMADEYGNDYDQQSDKIAAALDEAKKTGKSVSMSLRPDCLDDDEEADPDELERYSVWYMPPGHGETKPNFGFGEGEAKDKYANVWVEVGPYQQDPEMRERLEKLDREELLAILLRTHAAHYLSFPA